MSANRTSTTESPRKPTGAFFHWETPGEPIAVLFHLNIVDLLERDLLQSEGIGLSGVLLGRIERGGQKSTVIVEDYESASNLAQRDASKPELEDRHLLEEIVDRWYSRPEKRMSILGFYRSCPPGQVSLNSDDLGISSPHLAEAERIFLLLEPRMAMASTATLCMVKDGAISWQWHSVSFNRKGLAEKGSTFQSQLSGSQDPPPRSQKVIIPEKQDFHQGHEKHLKASYKVGLALGIVIILITVVVGILPLRSTQMFHVLAGTFKVSDEPAALALKLQRIGSDWQLSWDPAAPYLLKAAVGHLSITDGFIHKSVDLDASDLRGGSIMYTPATDDVTLRLEVVDAGSLKLANGTARMLGGLLPSRPDLVQTAGDSQGTRGHSKNVNPSISAQGPIVRGSTNGTTSAGSSHVISTPASGTISLAMRPPANPIAHELVNREPAVTQPNPVNALRGTDTVVSPSLPAAPPELNVNATGTNLTFPSSPRPIAQPSVVRPAELITRRDPIYPEVAKRSRTTGTVELQFRVSAIGKIEDVKVIKGSPVLAPAAIDAVRSWRYKPARVKEIPVDSIVSASIAFKLN